MPRKSSVAYVGVPQSRSFTKSRVKVASISGRPADIIPPITFPAVFKPSYKMAGITRLQKVDVSKGITMPEANKLPFIAGVIAPGNASYGPSRILLQHPVTPPKQGGPTRKLIAAPSPTGHAGVRSPYNQKTRVSRPVSNKRFGKQSGGAYSVGVKKGR